MSDVLTFWDKTIETISLEIKETQKELNNKLENKERKEIKSNLRKNEEINRKHLQKKKEKKKSSCLKIKPTTWITISMKTDNPRGKPIYASILRKRSNTNIQRKLRKQNIAENNNSISIA